MEATCKNSAVLSSYYLISLGALRINALFPPAVTCNLLFLLVPPQTPAPSRTSSFYESKADEVAPAKKAKPAIPQGNSQLLWALCPSPLSGPCRPAEVVEGIGLCCEGRCGAWDGNRPEDALSLPCGLSWCLGPTLHLDYLGNLTLHRLLFPFPLPSVDVCELGRGLQRKHGYRNTRRWEGLPDSTPKWKAGAWSSGRQSKLPTHPIILGLLQRYSFPASLL